MTHFSNKIPSEASRSLCVAGIFRQPAPKWWIWNSLLVMNVQSYLVPLAHIISFNLFLFDYILPQCFLPLLIFCMSYSMTGWLVASWLGGPGCLLFFLSRSLFSQAYITLLIYSLCPPTLLISPLPGYWPFSFLLGQSSALSRQSKTAIHFYIINQKQHKQM